MKSSRKIITILISLVFIFVLSCEEIPDKDLAGNLKLSIDIPDGALNTSGEKTVVTAATDGDFESAFVTHPFPGSTTYHLRLHISNPDETHFVLNYNPGDWLTLSVFSGSDRVITVDAYEVSPMNLGVGMPPLSHFVTVTPLSDRTITLQGEPVDLKIQVGRNPDTGAISAAPPYLVETSSGSTLSLPMGVNCPTANRYFATIKDVEWDLAFPSFPVAFYAGSIPGAFSIPGLPIGQRFSITVFHLDTGIESKSVLPISDTSNPIQLYFTNYKSPSVTFAPEMELKGLIPGDSVDVVLGVDSGLGTFTSAAVGPEDTCGGNILGNLYNFAVPDYVSSCVINVIVDDCGGTATSAIITAKIVPNPPPACMDGIDNDFDGRVDFPADPGCTSATEDEELGVTDCDDGVDSDGWGEGDVNDPGCTGPADTSELDAAVECDDGIDNDGWLDIDIFDPGCLSPIDASEGNTLIECDDYITNDYDSLVDANDPGCANALDISELSLLACDDGVDNDGWSDIDMNDPGCTAPDDASEFDPAVECDDGVDNPSDTDTVVDVLDPGCANSTDNSELGSAECDDGINNDSWPDIDMNDPGCTGPADTSELNAALECDDGVDNGDSDALVDSADTGCSGATDPSELDPTAPCDDGANNDYDSLTDLADPGCTSPTDPSEFGTVDCDDGLNNDYDSLIDMNDPGCTGPTEDDEMNPAIECDDGVDNDGWTDIDMGDPGCTSPTDTSEYGTNACDDGADNDGWGDIDVADPGCTGAADTSEYGSDVCDDGADNDSDGVRDASDSGCSSPTGSQEWVTWFVSTIGNNSTGLSWANAFNNVQTAIDNASRSDLVFVRQGSYYRPIAGNGSVVYMKSYVNLYGGFAGTELLLSERGNPRNFPTILNGENLSYHVVTAQSYSRLDGFGITGGNSNQNGGGMYISSNPGVVIDKCHFYSNRANAAGGGILISRCAPTITNTIFNNNLSNGADSGLAGNGSGGAIALYRDCNAVIKNCLFFANTGTYFGGGVSAWPSSTCSPSITNCTFVGNIGSGAVANWNTGNGATVRNCIFRGNSNPQLSTGNGGWFSVEYSNVQGGYGGTGNINADPLFVAGPRHNYYLSQIPLQGSNSPSLDTGNNTAAALGLAIYSTRTDHLGDTGTVDMGYHALP
jgi:hypothetical protein